MPAGRRARRVGRTRPAAPIGAGTRSARWACSARSAPEARGGLGLQRARPRAVARGDGPGRVAGAVGRARDGRGADRRPVVADRHRGARDRRRWCRTRTPPTRCWSKTTSGCCWCRASALVVEPRPSVDHSRHVAAVDWDAGAGEVTEVGGAEALAAAFDRGALGTAAQLLGLAAGAARHDRRVRDRAQAVRGADRLAAGDQAQAGRRPGRARVRPPAGLPGRLLTRRRRSGRLGARLDGQGPRR